MGIIKGIFSVLIPGAGAFLRRKYLTAAGLGILFLALVQAYALLWIVSPAGLPDYVRPAILAGALVMWAVCASAELCHVAAKRRHGDDGAPEGLYRQALGAYMSGDDMKTDQILASVLKVDSLNPDLLFVKAQVAAHRGKRRRARRLFRKCRDFDENGKWRWEIEKALESLK